MEVEVVEGGSPAVAMALKEEPEEEPEKEAEPEKVEVAGPEKLRGGEAKAEGLLGRGETGAAPAPAPAEAEAEAEEEFCTLCWGEVLPDLLLLLEEAA